MDSHAQAPRRALSGTGRFPDRTAQLRRTRDHCQPDPGGLGRFPRLDRRGNGPAMTTVAQSQPRGTPPRIPPQRRADAGLFGPGSVTWRVLGEPIMWVAGLRAMYL